MSNEVNQVGTTSFMSLPPPVWKMTLCRQGDLKFQLTEGPNWFHRQMQRWCLGIHWERL